METLITNGIKITVDTQFEPLHSNALENKYLYSYHIAIENLSEYTVQLLSRHWFIFDSIGVKREVKGDGVIGQQPILQPGQLHEYSSWCPLTTALGRMYGSYLMRRLNDQSTFKVEIPVFELLAPVKLN
jgi:ApaG protein